MGKKFALIFYRPNVIVDEHGCLKFNLYIHNVLLFDDYLELRKYEDSDECRKSGYHYVKTMNVTTPDILSKEMSLPEDTFQATYISKTISF